MALAACANRRTLRAVRRAAEVGIPINASHTVIAQGERRELLHAAAPFPGISERPMNCMPCIVFPTLTREWMVHVDGASTGPFADLDLAMQIAATEALLRRRSGRSARVVVVNEDGRTSAERCLCKRFGR